MLAAEAVMSMKSTSKAMLVPYQPLKWLLVLAVAAAWSLVPARSLSASELPVGATLSVLADPVEVAAADNGTFGAAVSGQSLSAGDTVRTGSSGVALLTFYDGSETQMGGNSQLQIEQADYTPAPQIALFQAAGSSVNRVIPLPPDGSFRTDTPDATGLVRGTSYVVSVGDDASTLVLLTDRDGHVGHVQVVPAQAADVLDLVQAGDAGSASSVSSAQPQTTVASHLPDDALAALEQAARDLHDASGAAAAGAIAAAPGVPATPASPAVPATAAGPDSPGGPPIPASPDRKS